MTNSTGSSAAIQYDAASSPPTVDSPKNLDVMARIWKSNDRPDDINFAAMDTRDFTNKLRGLIEENTILKDMVNNLWETLRYSHEYTTFLLGQYNTEEFTKIAKSFATTPDSDIEKKQLIKYITVVFSTISDQELTSSDLSTMLNIDCSLIESTMSNLPQKVAK